VARDCGVPVDRVDIAQPGAEAWASEYACDIPVVHLNG
jgi:hypothetical protein